MCSKYWCFTLNNPENHHPLPDTWEANGHKLQLLIYQYEIGENNTEHIQGYVEFISRKKISTLKNINQHVHWEKRKGTRIQAIEYCKKDSTRKPNTVPYEWPEDWKKSEDTKVNEYDEIRLKLKAGTSMLEIADSHFRVFLRSNKGLRDYEAMCNEPRSTKTEVIVIFGPTGTGKSRWCHDHFPTAYWKSKNEWWDHYNYQDCVVIDEYYGWLKYDYFLRLLDRYPFICEYKGGSKQFNSKLIILTSNKHPKDWYTKFNTDPMFRRFDHVWEFHTIGEEPTIHHGDNPNTFVSLCPFAVQTDTINMYSDEIMEEDVEFQEEQVPDQDLVPDEILAPIDTLYTTESQVSVTDLFLESQ